MAYISRSEWGALPPKSRLSPWGSGQPTSWTLHWKGVFVPVNRSRAFYDEQVRGIQRSHYASSEGYWDIAYNFLVSPIGDIYEGRGWNHKSGAQASGNPTSIAACYIGGPGTDFTNLAQNAFKWLTTQKPLAATYPHSFWLPTQCPGPSIKAWINLGQPPGKECKCPDVGEAPPPPPPPKPARRSFAIGPTLQQGNKGISVTTLQHRLNLVTGAGLAVDGDFGHKTDHKVRDFQRYFKLVVDGIVGPKTWGLLNYFYAVKGGR